jgi:hypothetical protein
MIRMRKNNVYNYGQKYKLAESTSLFFLNYFSMEKVAWRGVMWQTYLLREFSINDP